MSVCEFNYGNSGNVYADSGMGGVGVQGSCNISWRGVGVQKL